jgi:predicted amidohydrolase
MKIGCLQVTMTTLAGTCFAERIQFNPQVGDVQNNIRRAEAILAEGDPKDLDLLILPEMAFSGRYKRSTSQF